MGQSIKESTIDDIRPLLKVCQSYFDQSPYNDGYYRYEPDHYHDYIRRCIINPSAKFYTVRDDETNQVVGLMSLVLGPIQFQREIRGYVEYIYILPEFRSDDLFDEMIKLAEDTAREMGCIDLLIGDVGFNSIAFSKKMKAKNYTSQAVICRKKLREDIN